MAPKKSNQKKNSTNLKTLDLHGYTEDEVVDAIEQFLKTLKGQSRARIMTGKGKGIVKKAVIDYLKLARYPWKYEKLSNGKTNEGVLILYLD